MKSYVEDTLMQSGSFTINDATRGQPGFGNITFAKGIKDGKPINTFRPADAFPLETIQIIAFFDGMNLAENTEWVEEWDIDGRELSSLKHVGTQGSEASQYFTARLSSMQRLTAGTYTLKLLISGRIVQLATVVIGQ